MDADYWRTKWANQQIAFHQREANPHLVANVSRLRLAPGSRVFVPLCGKTRDIAWLLDQGYRVAGAELVRTAVEQLFDELGVTPQITSVGALRHYRAPGIDIFAGDLFALTAETLGPVDAVYDRAALVALPVPMRDRYVGHVMALAADAPQLLVAYVYDQSVLSGPPFSVSRDEVQRHYGPRYKVTLLGSFEVSGGLKGQCPAHEDVWLIAG